MRRWWHVGFAGVLLATTFPGGTARPSAAQTTTAGLEVRPLSTRPEMVSGGDVLVEIQMPAGVGSDRLSVIVNGQDRVADFKAAGGRALVGLVTNLPAGRSEIQVSVNGQPGTQRLAVVNHPIEGPVFSGPHQTPFICETRALGLGESLDVNCAAATKVAYLYRSTVAGDGNPFKPYNANERPGDVAKTTTVDGKVVPYIVRREMGTINRAVYVIEFLHEPGTPLPDPWLTNTTWNRRLVYSFGGGCGAGYHQGPSVGGLNAARDFFDELNLGDYALAKGYAVASSSLNVYGTTCNDVISAETLMMVKEHFIEEYGAPRYTIGSGASGGSMAQQQIANNYPGLLDGIMPLRSFPDTISFVQPLLDCELLKHVLDDAGAAWTAEQKAAVAGHHWEYCSKNGGTFPLLRASACDKVVPETGRYDSVRNANGARCTYQDNLKNVYGRDPQTGFAPRPFDNVGVQYGLKALNSGGITFDQFLDLNRRIGGFDLDGRIVAARMRGDSEAIQTAYRTGRLNQGAGLAGIPIIDVRAFLDPLDDVHDAVRTQVMEARLRAANGSVSNRVWITTATVGGTAKDNAEGAPFRTAVRSAFDAMDTWLAAIAADRSPARSALERVSRNRPSQLVDACYTERGEKVTDAAKCLQLFPRLANPRLAAGEPMTLDRLKCELKPVNAQDYSPRLADSQLAAMKAVFPQGVCDYSKKGVGQVPGQRWLSYPGPGPAPRVTSTASAGDR